MEVGAFGDGLTVYIKGYDTLMQTIRKVETDTYERVRQVIRQQGEVVLSDAKGYAMAIRDTGDFAASLRLSDTQRGVKLVTDDPGAGTIEFANPGAVYLRSKYAGLPIGVPRKATNPRAMVPAVLDNEQGTFTAVENAIAILCDQVRGE